MDVEKTMQFILEQQGDFAAHIGALREQQEKSAQQIERLVELARLHSERLEALVEVARLQSDGLDCHHRRLQAQEKWSEVFQQRFDQFLERFDAYLRGRGGDGR